MFPSSSRSGYGVAPCPPGSEAAMEESVLVLAARADPLAFAPLYERYLGPVYRYCYLRLGSREVAEDATSEVFMKVLAGLEGYRGGVFAAWLFRIAHNAVADVRRRHRPIEPMERAANQMDPSLSPEEAVLARDEARALREALALLSEDQQAVLTLQLAGWSGGQIAAALGKSVDGVKMLRYRAVVRLRMLLTRDELDRRENRDD